jgi:hypothetical protein
MQQLPQRHCMALKVKTQARHFVKVFQTLLAMFKQFSDFP